MLNDGSYAVQKVISQTLDAVEYFEYANIDSDNFPDVIQLSTNDSTLSWFKNLGNGNFSQEQIISTNSNADIFTLIDIENDGDVDVATIDYTNGILSFYENYGNGLFSSEISVSNTLAGPSRLEPFDVNNDNLYDLLVYDYGDLELVWFENLGGGIFGLEQNLDGFSNNFNSLAFGDIDNDGYDDIVNTASNVPSWYKNMGDSEFELQPVIGVIPIGGSGYDLLIEDFDADGDMDVYLAGSDKLGWFENNGGSSFFAYEELGISGNTTFLTSGDLNNDGDKDLISPNWGITFLYSNQVLEQTQIKGMVYSDLNQNGQYDAGDIGLSNTGIYSLPESDYTFSSTSGNYFLNFDDTAGVYVISAGNSLIGWGLTTDSSNYTINVDSNFVVMDSLDFGFYPNVIYDSLSVELMIGFPSCSQNRSLWIEITNLGTSLPSGIISLTLDDSLSFISSLYPPDSIIGQNLYWSIDSLIYFSSFVNQMVVQMPDFNSMGDNLVSHLNILVYDSLGNLSYSTVDSLNQTLMCAYDPNDKISKPSGIDSMGYVPISTDYIEYTIRFQNTGTDTAHQVIIEDYLDNNLNWQSLIPIASSHTYSTQVEENGLVRFVFENIELVDSNTNQIMSNGFITYGIELNTDIPIGTSIYNEASIYFDFNPPIITNTKILTLFECSGAVNNVIFTDTICKNDILYGISNYNSPDVNYNWELPGIINNNYSELIWPTDTVGLLEWTFTVEMIFCLADTLLLVEVLAVDSTYLGIEQICQGDSTMIFNSFESIAGIYTDTLISIIGCDSVLHKSLLVNTLPPISLLSFPEDTVCLNSGIITLPEGTPMGGSYSNNGNIIGEFNTINLGEGIQEIVYSYGDANNCINSDTTVIHIIDCAGISNSDDIRIIIYPNPSTGMYILELPVELNKDTEIEIYDVSSKLIRKTTALNNEDQIYLNLGEFNDCIYYIHIIINNKTYIRKLIKVKE